MIVAQVPVHAFVHFAHVHMCIGRIDDRIRDGEHAKTVSFRDCWPQVFEAAKRSMALCDWAAFLGDGIARGVSG